MQITPEHIKLKKFVGKTPNGVPVTYVETFGGLHIMMGNINGKVEVLSALPHLGMAKWLADKKCPQINWDREALLGL